MTDVAAVVQALAAGGDVRSLLAAQLGDDPAMAALAQLMAPEPAEEAPALDADPRDAELAALRRRNLMLASALGACPACWGAAVACVRCGGAGAPGWVAPDPAHYDVLVAPAVWPAPERQGGDDGQRHP